MTRSALSLDSQHHEDRILAEYEAANQRAIAESLNPTCACGGIYCVVKRLGGGLDDHTTDWLRCLRCGEGYVVTVTSSPEHIEVSEWRG